MEIFKYIITFLQTFRFILVAISRQERSEQAHDTVIICIASNLAGVGRAVSLTRHRKSSVRDKLYPFPDVRLFFFSFHSYQDSETVHSNEEKVNKHVFCRLLFSPKWTSAV